MLHCWSLLIGASKLRGGRRVFSAADDRRLREITTRHFPEGFTILHAAGSWFDPKRKRFVREESRQVLICAAGTRAVRTWGRELGTALRQQELLVVRLGPAMTLKLR